MFRKYIAHNSLLPFYLAWQIDPKGFNYNINFSYQLPDASSIDVIIAKLQELINLKPYLRQTFAFEDDQLIVCIHDHLPAEIHSFMSSTAEFSAIEQELTKNPHDISINSSIKLSIIRFRDKNDCVILFNIHHIFMDGLSLSHFIADLNVLLSGGNVVAENVNEHIEKIAAEPPLKLAYSSPQLDKYIQEVKEIAVELDYPLGNKEILFYTDALPDEITSILIDFSEKNKISIYNLMLLTWSVFTAKLFNHNASLVNYPVQVKVNKSVFGCFVNMVTLPLSLDASKTFSSLIKLWRGSLKVLKAAAHSKFGNELSLDGIPAFSLSHVCKPDELIIQGKYYIPKAYPQIANSNLNIKYREIKNKFFFSCEVYSGIFPDYFSSSLLKRFFNFLNKLLTNPFLSLSNVDLTFDEEKRKLLYDFNNNDDTYPEEKTLVDLFEKIVIQYPDKIAVKAFNGELSYYELNRRAEQLAALLIENGVKPDDIVGVLIDNRLEMIIAIIAILKSGAAYLPITYTMPEGSIKHIFKESRIKLLLSLPHLAKNIDISLRIIDVSAKYSHLKMYIKPTIKPNNLAYVIYTSGTTGIPKGILIEHRSVVNYVMYLIKDNKLDSNSVGSKYAVFGFDASVIEIYPILLCGGLLCIIKDKDRIDPQKVNKFFLKNSVNYAFLPSNFAEQFFKLSNACLKNLIVGGDKLNKFINKPYRVVNAYGPTEATVQTHSFVVSEQSLNIPIGRPISNVKSYVVDKNLNILPIGLVGELAIGGASLARGYLNASTLTTEKFIENPFQTDSESKKGKNRRIYKTGDLVRCLPNGNLEYIGRNDSQIKIRGYRIELSYIKSILIGYPGIEDSIILVKNYMHEKYIIAYYTSDKLIKLKNIKKYLIERLPEYMVPDKIIYLKNFMLTINGKIDKNSLPEINLLSNSEPPKNYQEKLVCEGFSSILRLNKIGVNDNFFELGGDSIKSIMLVSLLQDNFNLNVSDIYYLRTPRRISTKFSLRKNSLITYLNRIKSFYQEESHFKLNDDFLKKFEKYRKSVEEVLVINNKKTLNNVLLTGSTGFLGCNLLNELLSTTNYMVFLLVREKSNLDARTKINDKFQFYFGKPLNFERLFVFASDIEKENLGLSEKDYRTLASCVDSIIHSAALTKRYGGFDKFYSANVQATINLLKFCKLTNVKDFHYISTTSILETNYMTEKNKYIFTEDDNIPENIEDKLNIYIKSKAWGEKIVQSFRQQGITSNIYRVGNLAFMANNLCSQQNSEENGFLNRLKAVLNLGIIAQEIGMTEISPVDLTAKAIIKLFDNESLRNYTHHVFNPYPFNLSNFFLKNDFFNVKIVSINQFIDTIIEHLRNSNMQMLIVQFLAHQGWLNEWCLPVGFAQVLQERTHTILQQLGFKWSPVYDDAFANYLKREAKIGKESESVTTT